MATTKDYIDFVCENIHGTGIIRYRKMFGEYMVYVNDKPLLLVCDNTVYVKKHEALNTCMQAACSGVPYTGAKEHYVLDIENRELCQEVIGILEPITLVPKPKKKKS